MRLTYFFQGTLRKEETASAFLAMAIEGVPSFRKHFFELVFRGELTSNGEREWTVTVETERVDVRIEASDTVILVENKIRAGAMQQGQLLRYYVREIKQNPEKRIAAVFLAPGDIGKEEVMNLMDSSEYRSRPQDLVRHVSWQQLADYTLSLIDTSVSLIQGGLDEILKIIKEMRTVKYAREGEREVIRGIVDSAFTELGERTSVGLRRWSGRDIEEILTAGTNVTMWLDAVFATEDVPPFAPINLRDENGLVQVTIKSQFKLAGRIKKSSDLSQWWGMNVLSDVFEVPGVGSHHPREDGWFVHTAPISETEERIAGVLADTGEAVLEALHKRLSSAGFALACDRSPEA